MVNRDQLLEDRQHKLAALNKILSGEKKNHCLNVAISTVVYTLSYLRPYLSAYYYL